MACVNPDGTLTRPGRRVLAAMLEPRRPEEVAAATEIALFRIRSIIRELMEAGMVAEADGLYMATATGREKLEA
ncbi:hypothetical protein [Desulfurispora thermophila]|uniref:hypothetical protein n=1 Tax=Desulfurispora thermophila TaxID=265470 RepID=UPI00037FD67D|nr:hypothetical protein [Desulfurispora thermophila]